MVKYRFYGSVIIIIHDHFIHMEYFFIVHKFTDSSNTLYNNIGIITITGVFNGLSYMKSI